MRTAQIIGWKTYAVAVLALIAGGYALTQRLWAEGIKGILFGLALIALRDVLGKILSLTDANRRTLADLRATIEADLTSRDKE